MPSTSTSTSPTALVRHTFNPLIVPDVNPFPASVIRTVTVHIFSTDHCIIVTGPQKVSVSVLTVRRNIVVLLYFADRRHY